jgi:nucleotide-binding universal stress UspA family protein
MFEKIVVATDISKVSDVVVGCLGGLLALGAKEAVLVHAVGLRHLHDMAPWLYELAEPRLAEQKASLERQGFSTTVAMAPGAPMFEVNRLAREHCASLIVVGSHGASCTKDILLGGVALAILHHATIPVLVVRLKIDDTSSLQQCVATCRNFTHHILYATDFSDTAERAFGHVEKLVESGARDITLLHVQDRVKIGKYLESRLEEFNETDRMRLERMKKRLNDLGATNVRIELPYGSPIQEIIKSAQREEETLVVMGSQGQGYIREVFMGSVSHGVAMHSGAPLLLIPTIR